MDPSNNDTSRILKVVLGPPSAIRPGVILYPPLVVSVQLGNEMSSHVPLSPDRHPEDTELEDAVNSPLPAHSASETANEEYEGLWAFVHLVSEASDENQESNPTPGYIALGLRGSLTDSPHRATSLASDTEPQYVKFENLAIHNVGIFSLRVTLCRMSDSYGDPALGLGAATMIACVSTHKIFVHPSGHHPLGA